MHTARWIAGFVLSLYVAVNPIPAPAQPAGSWVGDAVTPTLRQRGLIYALASLKPAASTPIGGQRITKVAWRFDFHAPRPRGLQINICARGRCVEARPPGGTNAAFAGLPPATEFTVLFAVAGEGMLESPLAQAPMQLVVNFE